MAVRRITTGRRELIRRLSDILSGFLPLTSHSEHAVTFNSIFAESKVDRYLEGPSKKKALQKAWENVFRLYPRLPYTLIRKIVPSAIEYRRYKRNPLKQAELDTLIDCLEQLGMNMSKELREVRIDETVPEICVPPQELVKRLEHHPLSSEIASEPLVLFRNGHFNESVRKAAERFEVFIQQKTGATEIGKNLMSKVFSLSNPVIALNSLTSENERQCCEN